MKNIYEKNFEEGLEKLLDSKNISAGEAVSIMSNMDAIGKKIPLGVYSAINHDFGFEVPEDKIILDEVAKYIDGDFADLGGINFESADGLVLVKNLIRTFKPVRGGRSKNVLLDLPYDPKSFNFNLDACDSCIFHEESVDGHDVSFLYNRYPFLKNHSLMLFDRKKSEHSQFIDPCDDRYILSTALNVAKEHDLILGYNSNGACASVNNLHFHVFSRDGNTRFPVESVIGNLSGKSTDFDWYLKGAKYVSYHDVDYGLNILIDEMNYEHQKGRNVAYNFIVFPEGAVFYPRLPQHDDGYVNAVDGALLNKGYAFSELSGAIVTNYDGDVSNGLVKSEFSKTLEGISLENK